MVLGLLWMITLVLVLTMVHARPSTDPRQGAFGPLFGLFSVAVGQRLIAPSWPARWPRWVLVASSIFVVVFYAPLTIAIVPHSDPRARVWVGMWYAIWGYLLVKECRDLLRPSRAS